tara:strand:+ start:62 stop:457 length:396 start_codon:yes stop_codon:yes gene_type:complete
MHVFTVNPNGSVNTMDLSGYSQKDIMKAVTAATGSVKDLPGVDSDCPEEGYEPKVKLPVKELVVLDKENKRVRSSVTGVTKWLTPEEIAVYDYMNGVHRFGGDKGSSFQKCVKWFELNNPDAFNKVIKELL